MAPTAGGGVSVLVCRSKAVLVRFPRVSLTRLLVLVHFAQYAYFLFQYAHRSPPDGVPSCWPQTSECRGMSCCDWGNSNTKWAATAWPEVASPFTTAHALAASPEQTQGKQKDGAEESAVALEETAPKGSTSARRLSSPQLVPLKRRQGIVDARPLTSATASEAALRRNLLATETQAAPSETHDGTGPRATPPYVTSPERLSTYEKLMQSRQRKTVSPAGTEEGLRGTQSGLHVSKLEDAINEGVIKTEKHPWRSCSSEGCNDVKQSSLDFHPSIVSPETITTDLGKTDGDDATSPVLHWRQKVLRGGAAHNESLLRDLFEKNEGVDLTTRMTPIMQMSRRLQTEGSSKAQRAAELLGMGTLTDDRKETSKRGEEEGTLLIMREEPPKPDDDDDGAEEITTSWDSNSSSPYNRRRWKQAVLRQFQRYSSSSMSTKAAHLAVAATALSVALLCLRRAARMRAGRLQKTAPVLLEQIREQGGHLQQEGMMQEDVQKNAIEAVEAEGGDVEEIAPTRKSLAAQVAALTSLVTTSLASLLRIKSALAEYVRQSSQAGVRRSAMLKTKLTAVYTALRKSHYAFSRGLKKLLLADPNTPIGKAFASFITRAVRSLLAQLAGLMILKAALYQYSQASFQAVKPILLLVVARLEDLNEILLESLYRVLQLLTAIVTALDRVALYAWQKLSQEGRRLYNIKKMRRAAKKVISEQQRLPNRVDNDGRQQEASDVQGEGGDAVTDTSQKSSSTRMPQRQTSATQSKGSQTSTSPTKQPETYETPWQPLQEVLGLSPAPLVIPFISSNQSSSPVASGRKRHTQPSGSPAAPQPTTASTSGSTTSAPSTSTAPGTSGSVAVAPTASPTPGTSGSVTTAPSTGATPATSGSATSAPSTSPTPGTSTSVASVVSPTQAPSTSGSLPKALAQGQNVQKVAGSLPSRVGAWVWAPFTRKPPSPSSAGQAKLKIQPPQKPADRPTSRLWGWMVDPFSRWKKLPPSSPGAQTTPQSQGKRPRGGLMSRAGAYIWAPFTASTKPPSPASGSQVEQKSQGPQSPSSSTSRRRFWWGGSSSEESPPQPVVTLDLGQQDISLFNLGSAFWDDAQSAERDLEDMILSEGSEDEMTTPKNVRRQTKAALERQK